MYVFQTITATGSTANYELVNNLIGVIKNFILNDSKVSVISDNNPSDSTERRTVILKIGNSQHYLELTAYSYTDVSFRIKNIANTDVLFAASFNPLDAPARMVYAAHVCAILIGSSSCYIFFAWNLLSDNKWAVYVYASGTRAEKGTGDSVFVDDKDNYHYVFKPATDKRTTDGKYVLYPVLYYDNNTILPGWPVKVYGTTLASYSVFTDDIYYFITCKEVMFTDY